MNGGLDLEYESPADRIETEIRWINHNLEGENYNPEYREILRQKKLILVLQLISMNRSLSLKDKQAIRSLVFQTSKWKPFIFGLCVGAGIVLVVYCAHIMKGM